MVRPALRPRGSSANALVVKLSRIEIKGFKSIARKTAFVVADGVTCIAGPNGCGKSNIVDAVRWALGEQSPRALRASSMSEIIFSGTQDVPPSSIASVTLEFARNGGGFPKTLDGFERFSVTRRLSRSGESEYFINGVRCRLKDITDLFLDTGIGRNGYAIIEQGRIKDIIQARPEELRCLIEDAAEVGRFRVKRAEALRRLEAASQNLARARDLLDEVSRQRAELKAQASKARRYQELRARANDMERLLMADELCRVRDRRASLERELREIDARIASLEERASESRSRRISLEQEAEKARAHMEELSLDLAGARGERAAIMQRMEGLKARVSDLQDSRNRLALGVEETRRTLASMDDDKRGLEAGIEVAKESIVKLQDELDDAEKLVAQRERTHQDADRAYREQREALFALIGEMRALEERAGELDERHRDAVQRCARMRKDLADLDAEAVACDAEGARLDAERTAARAAREPLEAQVTSFDEECTQLARRIDEMSGRVGNLDVAAAQVSATIDMLDRVIAGDLGKDGDARGDLNGARILGDAISVKDGYETAVGLSLGSALDYVVVRDHSEILAMGHLHEKVPGFAVEIPYDTNGDRHAGRPVGAGVRGRLLDHIEAADECRGIVQALAKDHWVVDEIETAFELWKRGERRAVLVSMDGMVLEPSGILRTTREGRRYADILKARSERGALVSKRNALEEERRQISEELARAREAHRDLLLGRQEAVSTLTKLDHSEASLRERAAALEARRDRVEAHLGAAREDLEILIDMESRLASQARECREGLGVMAQRRSQMEQSLHAMERDCRAAREALDEARKTVATVRGRLHAEQVAQAHRQASLDAIVESAASQIRALSAAIDQMEKIGEALALMELDMTACIRDADQNDERIRSLESLAGTMMPEYERALNVAGACRTEEEGIRSDLDGLRRRRSELLLDLRESEVAWAMGAQRMEARFGLVSEDVPDGFDAGEARRIVAEIEERIERMGQINFASLEAHEQVQKRWEDLHRQYEDLVQASDRLREVIRNIERESSRAFSETFSKVKGYFQDIFTSMFGGGKADLVERPSDEGEEPGIEIFASPPFKRLRSMSLLSEGEKTLCAVSFVFALFRVNPSPFCILDEVDAPLDDANITRLNRLIRTFCAETQFLVVTHNRHTMEMADILYGVTYETPGISKVVSVALEEGDV